MIPDAAPGLAMVLPSEALIALGLWASLVAVVTAFSGWGTLHSRAHPADTADLPNRAGPDGRQHRLGMGKAYPPKDAAKVSYCANGREEGQLLPATFTAVHSPSSAAAQQQNGEGEQ